MYHYTVGNDGSAILTAVNLDNGAADLSLPESIDGHPLQALAAGCFDQCGSLQRLSIPSSVLSVEDGALDGCTSLETIEVSPDNPTLITKDGVLFQQKEEQINDSNKYVSKLYLIFYPPEKKDTYYFLPYSVESAAKLKSNYIETLELATDTGFSGSISDFPNLDTLIMNCDDLRCYECYQNLDTLITTGEKVPSSYPNEGFFPQGLHVISYEGSPAQELAELNGAQFEALERSTLELKNPPLYSGETTIKRRLDQGGFRFVVESNGSLEYESTNERMAAVDSSGKVTLRAAGVSNLFAYARYDGQRLPNSIKYKLSIEKDLYPISADPNYVKPGCDPFYAQVNKKYDDLELTFYTEEDESVLTVTPDGLVTLYANMPGIYEVYASNQETPNASATTILVPVVINLFEQKIIGPKKMNVVYGNKVKLNIQAKTPLHYRSSNKKIATVTSKGVVTFSRPGTVNIHTSADFSDVYAGTGYVTTLVCKLGKPRLKAKAGKKKVKLSWNSVYAAQKYLVYCKAPGKKSFKLVTTRLASVKSVTHKNLKKGKKYTYKVRVYAKIKGKKYYSPYSAPVTVKVR